MFTITVALPLVGSLLTYLLPSESKYGRFVALSFSTVTLLVCVDLWCAFDDSLGGYQFTNTAAFLPSLGVSLGIGVDGISFLFLLLNSFLVPICLLSSWDSIKYRAKEYFALFRMMEGFVNLVFITTDRLVFYLAFEMVLIPMFLVVGHWGSRERKVRASYFFFRYTLLGSVPFLIAILYLRNTQGTTDIQLLSFVNRSPATEILLWLAFFASFAVKVPIIPVHIWLPEAHVEAPTAGSVFLAGILLKLGTYGLVRLSIPRFPIATAYFSPMIVTLCLVAIVYASFTAIRQTDIKRIIAYASVAHMNITLLGIFSMTIVGISGGVFQMLAHGVVSGALFLCVGVLYDRYHSRLVSYYGGIAQFIPLYAIVFLGFTIANIALPGTANFTGEFLIMLGLMNWSTVGTFFSTSGLVLGGAYSLWLLNRIIYGNVKSGLDYTPDLSDIEKACLFPLFLVILWIGLYPEPFLASRESASSLIIVSITL